MPESESSKNNSNKKLARKRFFARNNLSSAATGSRLKQNEQII